MCMHKFYDKSLLLFIIIVEQTVINSIESTPSYENKETYKVKLDPIQHQLSDFFSLGHKFGLRTVSRPKNRTLENIVTTSPSYRKWQVGRVSRKQYEIINILWRRTKEIGDVDMTTVNFYTNDPLFKIPSNSKSMSTSSSFIEFYYLVEDNNQKHHLHKDERSPLNLDKIKRGTADYPSFTFSINNPIYAPLALRNKQKYTNEILQQKYQTPSPLVHSLPNYIPLQIPNQGIPRTTTLVNKIESAVFNYFKSKHLDVPISSIDYETCPITETLITFDHDIKNKNSNIIKFKSTSTRPKLTTVYDRIKFFEMYDKGTPLPFYDENEKPIDLDDVERSIHGNKLRSDFSIIIENVSQNNVNNATHKAKHAKKHIISNNLRTYNEELSSISIVNATTRNNNISHRSVTESVSASTNITEFTISKINVMARWSDYSFMAAYIYEPSQVYCDAAGISPHWLITSGSCLSRRHNNPRSEGRSAFVAYCGSAWWNPDRVVYVKYSVIHPRYHQRDKQRMYMYNIGLIQVEISMTTCPGWAPVPLMSHQFAGYTEGSKAYAIGWGLDRYEIRHTSNLPRYPLTAYESRVFSNSCPGIFNQTELKYRNSDGGIKNLYCLLLPPYNGEETDPIHGSMLLIEGKLCALYLQEERRPSGDQSAQYTGTWRLGPWVTDMARESEDTETFSYGK